MARVFDVVEYPDAMRNELVHRIVAANLKPGLAAAR